MTWEDRRTPEEKEKQEHEEHLQAHLMGTAASLPAFTILGVLWQLFTTLRHNDDLTRAARVEVYLYGAGVGFLAWLFIFFITYFMLGLGEQYGKNGYFIIWIIGMAFFFIVVLL